jgi:hypothetical protein
MFDPKSRYVNLAQYTVMDQRGRMVSVVPTPPHPNQTLLGYHILRQGERLDHLASRYLSDPAGYWRIAERNDVMLAEDLTERREIAIPGGVQS